MWIAVFVVCCLLSVWCAAAIDQHNNDNVNNSNKLVPETVWTQQLDSMIDDVATHPKCVDIILNVMHAKDMQDDTKNDTNTTTTTATTTTTNSTNQQFQHKISKWIPLVFEMAENSTTVTRALNLASRAFIPIVREFMNVTKCNVEDESQPASASNIPKPQMQDIMLLQDTLGKVKQGCQAFFFLFGIILHVLGCEDIPTAAQWQILELPVPQYASVWFDNLCSVFYWGRWFRSIDDLMCWNPKTAPDGCNLVENFTEFPLITQQALPLAGGPQSPSGMAKRAVALQSKRMGFS